MKYILILSITLVLSGCDWTKQTFDNQSRAFYAGCARQTFVTNLTDNGSTLTLQATCKKDVR